MNAPTLPFANWARVVVLVRTAIAPVHVVPLTVCAPVPLRLMPHQHLIEERGFTAGANRIEGIEEFLVAAQSIDLVQIDVPQSFVPLEPM